MRFFLSRLLVPSLAFIFPLIVYLQTKHPTVAFIDSGELATVCYTLGISHPTGYPLYTLLGKFFSWFPQGSVITKLNLLSGIFVSGSVLFFFLSLKLLYSKLSLGVKDSFLSAPSSLFLALFFAFTPSLWSQATTNEVYSLNILFLSLLTFLLLRWNQTRSDKMFYLISFVYGLSFTNHMSSILLFPSLLFFFCTGWRTKFLSPGRILAGVTIFVLAFSLYLYLPIRSSTYPLLDWSHPASWHNFKNHFTGWQYHVWMFANSKAELLQNLTSYGELLLQQFYPLVVLLVELANLIFFLGGMLFGGIIVLALLVGLAGLVLVVLRRLKLATFFLLLIISTIIYGINYSIGDIEGYFLPSYLAFAFLIAAGIWGLVNLVLTRPFRTHKKFADLVLLGISVLLAAWGLLRNFHPQDKSKHFFAYDLTSNILESASPPALILTDIWDYYSPYLYIHFIEGKFPHRVMLDKELLRRSWYSEFIRQAHPQIYHNSESEINEFLGAVYPFERQMKYDPNYIEEKYQKMLRSIVDESSKNKNVYFIFGQQDRFARGYPAIPEGLAFRVQSESEYAPYRMPEFRVRGVADPEIAKDERTRFHLRLYPAMLEARARYEVHFGHDSLAVRYSELAARLRKALEN
jgi:hypothetical protein